MSEEKFNLEFTDEMKEYVGDLVKKSLTIMGKSKDSSNVGLKIFDAVIPIRVDDYKLLYIGGYLLPNILNYLVNILPQFLYPYIVAYLQDLSQMRDDPITINELFDYLINYNHGNIHDGSETED